MLGLLPGPGEIVRYLSNDSLGDVGGGENMGRSQLAGCEVAVLCKRTVLA